MTAKPKSFPAEVWATLSAVNVNEHIEKKPAGSAQISYLSWAWAWQTLMEYYPESVAEYAEPKKLDDNSVEIWCTVTVIAGDKSHKRDCWLPVMDHRNNAVKNPDARAISDTRQRCLVKCLALHGLGLYIYAGEDLPSAEKDAASAEAKAKAEADAKAVEDAQQNLLADCTAKLEECPDKATLRAEVKRLRPHFSTEYWDKLVKWSTIRAKELPDTLAGSDAQDAQGIPDNE